jgi:hypothetical protein
MRWASSVAAALGVVVASPSLAQRASVRQTAIAFDQRLDGAQGALDAIGAPALPADVGLDQAIRQAQEQLDRATGGDRNWNSERLAILLSVVQEGRIARETRAKFLEESRRVSSEACGARDRIRAGGANPSDAAALDGLMRRLDQGAKVMALLPPDPDRLDPAARELRQALAALTATYDGLRVRWPQVGEEIRRAERQRQVQSSLPATARAWREWLPTGRAGAAGDRETLALLDAIDTRLARLEAELESRRQGRDWRVGQLDYLRRQTATLDYWGAWRVIESSLAAFDKVRGEGATQLEALDRTDPADILDIEDVLGRAVICASESRRALAEANPARPGGGGAAPVAPARPPEPAPSATPVLPVAPTPLPSPDGPPPDAPPAPQPAAQPPPRPPPPARVPAPGAQPAGSCSAPEGQVCIPPVEGLTLERAIAALERVGLTPAIVVGGDAPTRSDVGKIGTQVPGAGAVQPPGAEVEIHVWTEAIPTREVPDIIGVGEDEARRRLAARDLFLDIRDGNQPTKPGDVGVIYQQYPAPGTEVREGIGILGTRYAVPFRQPPPPPPPPEPPRGAPPAAEGVGPNQVVALPPGSRWRVLRAESRTEEDPTPRPIDVRSGRLQRPPSGWAPGRRGEVLIYYDPPGGTPGEAYVVMRWTSTAHRGWSISCSRADATQVMASRENPDLNQQVLVGTRRQAVLMFRRVRDVTYWARLAGRIDPEVADLLRFLRDQVEDIGSLCDTWR